MQNYEDCIESRIVDVRFDNNGDLLGIVMRNPTTGNKWHLRFSDVIELSGFDLAKSNIVDRVNIYSDTDFVNENIVKMAYEIFTKRLLNEQETSDLDDFRAKVLNDGVKLIHLQAVFGLELFVLARNCVIERL